MIITDTSLCAIVRDEIRNPAGGIVDFVNSVMPFVESGVIVDTGSKDGTREILEELSSNYRNLEIFDRKFDGYDTSRNFSFEKVETKRVLVLDADERLTRQDFEILKRFVEERPKKGYNFNFLDVYPDFKCPGINHNPRLFDKSKKLRYKGEFYESLYLGLFPFAAIPFTSINTKIEIKHFRPTRGAVIKKVIGLYYHYTRNLACGISPLELESFAEWKKLNPQREAYR